MLLMTFASLGCDMQPAETLDRPRVLALKTEPAVLSPGAEHTLTALLFDVPEAITWRACAEAWAPTDPPSCASGAIELGQGNPLVVALPDLDDLWLAATPVSGEALTAVKRLEASATGTNPEVTGLTTASGPLTTLPAGGSVELRVALEDVAAPEDLVVSWYTSAGTLEPGRTLASEGALLEAPTQGPVRVIAVVRDTGGGTGWTEATLEVGP